MSYLSFGLCFSRVFWRISNLFLTVTIYWLYISLLANKDQSYRTDLPPLYIYLLRRFFDWNTLSKEEYAYKDAFINTISIYNLARLRTTNTSRSNECKSQGKKQMISSRNYRGCKHSQEAAAARSIGLYMNSDKTKFMCFKQDGAISTLNGKPLKLLDHFTYLGSNISSTESNINICIGKAYTALNRLLSTRWKSNFSDKINQDFFQAIAMSVHVSMTTPSGAWRKS